MTDFLWHEVSDTEKKEIKKQAEQIMADFSKALEKVDKQIDEPFVEREVGEREEKENGKPLEIDRETMFDNAPKKDDDSIIAEVKKW